MTGTLYLVATPIGNLEDITQRALRILGEVDLIACEDTRHTRTLLNHYGIKTKMLSYHEHNERERAEELGALLEGGATIALVSDAGTPGISDPGYRLVNDALKRGARVHPIPGPTALVSALIASGLPTDEFYFGGFLPARAAQRRAQLIKARSIKATLIFYEAPHRINQALADAREILGEREAAVARELTKLHEEIVRAPLSDLGARFASPDAARGEMVLLIGGVEIDGGAATSADVSQVSINARVSELEREGLNHRAALKKAARELGLNRSEAYRRLVEERGREEK